MIGKTISQYKIIEKIGEGGMGIVYKAQDTKLDRFVALKFLPPHMAASEQDKARFVQEAKSAAALNHPNVCSIIDIQEHEQQMFIVMEFVDGHTLQEKKSSLTMKQAIDYGIQVAEGLAAAHEKGIIHRDIKPENIMIRKDGIAQIMDFGLAKLAGVTRLTKAGSTVGTLGYMSPEQVQGQETDHRSDIFSFGVLLYEMITGHSPFTGAHESAILYEIVNVDVAPPSTIKPELDPELDRIVLECLEKDPNERMQSIKQVAIDLNRFKRTSSRTRMSRTFSTTSIKKESKGDDLEDRSPIWKKYLWQGIAVLSILFSGILYITSMSDHGNTLPVMRFSISLPLATPLVGGASTIALAPDGKNIVYLAVSNGNPMLFLRPIDNMNSRAMSGTENANDPFFSPDGQWIGFFAEGKLKKISIFGGIAQDVCGISGFMRGGWWSEDNKLYFGNINNSIFMVPAEGGTPVAVNGLDASEGEISQRFPQLLPDGKTIIFTVKTGTMTSFNDALIVAENIETHERNIIVRGGSYARYVPTGHIIFVRGSSIFAVSYDIGTMKTIGPPIPIEEGGMLNPLSGDANYSVSSTGILLYAPQGTFTGTDMMLQWLDRSGKMTKMIDTVGAYADGSISPDGEKIAMTIRAANDDIWVYQFRRKTLTRITFGGKNSDFPIWTSDGNSIIYGSESGTTWKLFSKPWDGSGSEQLLDEQIIIDPSSWESIHPNGKSVAYGKDADILVQAIDGKSEPKKFVNTPASEINPSFSPDGKWMAYMSNESGQFEIFVVPYPQRSGKYQLSNSGVNSILPPRWINKGKSLVYTVGDQVMKIDIVTEPKFDYSRPQKIVTLPESWNRFFFDVMPDGSRFVIGTKPKDQMNTSQVHIVINWIDDLKKKFLVHDK